MSGLQKKKRRKGRKRTPKFQPKEGSSSQPQKKRKKKAVETMLQLLKSIDNTLEGGKSASQKVGADEEKGLSGSEDEVDVEVDQWIKENYDPRERVQQKKRKRSSADDDDETYVPPENVQVISPTSSGGGKKSTSRKRVLTPAARKLKFKLKIPPTEPQSKPPSPQSQPPSPPPQQPSSQHHSLSPIHEQPITSPHIQQTPPIPQPPIPQQCVDTTPGSSAFANFLPIPENIGLEQLDDFSFVNDDLVKKLQKKVDEVSAEKKKLEKRVKTIEFENSSLLKKVEPDQVEIHILKVRVAVLEEEKARRDEQNEYFKLKNTELEA
ncbi:hypothetical protein Hanom_Chr12g01143991 [Helianthus anomalus]